jgi:hypothetical protein
MGLLAQGERNDLKPKVEKPNILANLPQCSPERLVVSPGALTRPKQQQTYSREAAGKRMGIGGRTVQQAKKVAEKAPDLADKVKSGSMPLNRAYNQTKKREEAEKHNQPDNEQKSPSKCYP